MTVYKDAIDLVEKCVCGSVSSYSIILVVLMMTLNSEESSMGVLVGFGRFG